MNTKYVTSLELSKQLKEAGELWFDIPNYKGYQISSFGRVKSLARKNGMGSRLKDRILSQSIKNGYSVVCLYKNDKKKFLLVHRLVMWCCGPAGYYDAGLEVNHKDGNKLNNNAENLEWCTKSENQIHARKIGLMGGERTNTSKLTPEEVIEIRNSYPLLNSRQLSEKYHIGQPTICKIINRQYWRYI